MRHFFNNCDILVTVRLVSYTKKEIFMKDIYISGFADEISSSFDEQLKTVRELGMQYISLRSADKKGIADFTVMNLRSAVRDR